eukprot:185286-Rhodomonas_salina.2
MSHAGCHVDILAPKGSLLMPHTLRPGVQERGDGGCDAESDDPKHDQTQVSPRSAVANANRQRTSRVFQRASPQPPASSN